MEPMNVSQRSVIIHGRSTELKQSEVCDSQSDLDTVCKFTRCLSMRVCAHEQAPNPMRCLGVSTSIPSIVTLIPLMAGLPFAFDYIGDA
jgi:hypothetical protein